MTNKVWVVCPWCQAKNAVPRMVTTFGYEVTFSCYNCHRLTEQHWHIRKNPLSWGAEEEQWEEDAKKADVYDKRIVDSLSSGGKGVLLGDK